MSAETKPDNIGGFKPSDRVTILNNAGDWDGKSGTVVELDHNHGWRVWVRPDGQAARLRMDPDDLEHIAATPAPLDPTAVKAGDIVTEEVWYSAEKLQRGDVIIGRGCESAGGLFLVRREVPAPKPEWKPGTSGTATALHTSNVHGFCHLAGPDIPDTFAFTSDEGVTVPWHDVTDFVPDETRPLPTRDEVGPAIHEAMARNGYPFYGDAKAILDATDAVVALWGGESR